MVAKDMVHRGVKGQIVLVTSVAKYGSCLLLHVHDSAFFRCYLTITVTMISKLAIYILVLLEVVFEFNVSS